MDSNSDDAARATDAQQPEENPDDDLEEEDEGNSAPGAGEAQVLE